jgi:hypothetical protein
MKKFVISFFVLFVLCAQDGLKAQEEMFKALFMYNFTKDIEWPNKNGDFVITVLGNSPIVGELEKIATKKKVGNQPIKVLKVNNPSEIRYPHIVYIAPAKSSQLREVISNLNNKPVLVISDKPGLADQGSGINYVKINGKQKFEINPSQITDTGLKLNSFLISLGIVVE